VAGWCCSKSKHAAADLVGEPQDRIVGRLAMDLGQQNVGLGPA
jgi:hypothetical protein